MEPCIAGDAFVPHASSVTIEFRGKPTANIQSGAHIDNVTLTQNCCTPGDTDGDGIPDAWELAHGLNPDNPADAGLDKDGDGRTNLQEYNEGTDPTDPHSHLLLVPGGFGPGGWTIRFDAAANRSYTVERSPSLAPASRTAFASVPAEPVARTVELTVPDDGQQRGFFRVRTP